MRCGISLTCYTPARDEELPTAGGLCLLTLRGRSQNLRRNYLIFAFCSPILFFDETLRERGRGAGLISVRGVSVQRFACRTLRFTSLPQFLMVAFRVVAC